MGGGEFFMQSELKARGWTKSLIARFLGCADRTERNPHGRNAPAIKLYDLDRVSLAELDPAFIAAVAASAKRSATGRSVAERKTAALVDKVNAVPLPTLPTLSSAMLLARAIRHYNAMWNRPDKVATLHSPPEFLDRITVNYVRHSMTDYERRLDRLFGKVGKGAARGAIRCRIMEAIKGAYPWLAHEADRQCADG